MMSLISIDVIVLDYKAKRTKQKSAVRGSNDMSFEYWVLLPLCVKWKPKIASLFSKITIVWLFSKLYVIDVISDFCLQSSRRITMWCASCKTEIRLQYRSQFFAKWPSRFLKSKVLFESRRWFGTVRQVQCGIPYSIENLKSKPKVISYGLYYSD